MPLLDTSTPTLTAEQAEAYLMHSNKARIVAVQHVDSIERADESRISLAVLELWKQKNYKKAEFVEKWRENHPKAETIAKRSVLDWFIFTFIRDGKVSVASASKIVSSESGDRHDNENIKHPAEHKDVNQKDNEEAHQITPPEEWNDKLDEERVELIKKQFHTALDTRETSRLLELMEMHGRNRRQRHGDVMKKKLAELDQLIEALEVIQGIRPATNAEQPAD